jgi:hypothetical protein
MQQVDEQIINKQSFNPDYALNPNSALENAESLKQL